MAMKKLKPADMPETVQTLYYDIQSSINNLAQTFFSKNADKLFKEENVSDEGTATLICQGIFKGLTNLLFPVVTTTGNKKAIDTLLKTMRQDIDFLIEVNKKGTQ